MISMIIPEGELHTLTGSGKLEVEQVKIYVDFVPSSLIREHLFIKEDTEYFEVDTKTLGKVSNELVDKKFRIRKDRVVGIEFIEKK